MPVFEGEGERTGSKPFPEPGNRHGIAVDAKSVEDLQREKRKTEKKKKKAKKKKMIHVRLEASIKENQNTNRKHQLVFQTTLFQIRPSSLSLPPSPPKVRTEIRKRIITMDTEALFMATFGS